MSEGTMGIFSQKLRQISPEEQEVFEDSCLKEENESSQLFEGFTYCDSPEERQAFELSEDNEEDLTSGDEVILSTYNKYQLIEVTEDDNEIYYIIIAPDSSVMTEDFYSWAESEGIDFDSLPTSDKVARFADYVDSISS